MVMDNFHGFPAVKQRYWLVFTVGLRYKTKQTTHKDVQLQAATSDSPV